jgi:hypothetical protein
MLVDVYANKPQLTPEFVLKTFFGQLQHIFVVHIPVTPALGLEQPTTLFLVGIFTCHLEAQNSLTVTNTS